jgi:signal transduction histidine kinase
MDREQMKQVFLNLMLNAAQAMDRGGKLTIHTALRSQHPGDRNSPLVEIGIQDTGPGLSGDIRAKIFEPFFSTKEEGIGLGLPIAQRIVEEHGGEIRVGSSPGEGTTFYVILPLK